MTDRDRSLALAAALTTVLLWSSAFVGVRVAGEDLSPGPLTLARLLVGALVLGAVVAARREALPPRRDVPRLVLCGLLWFAAYNVLLNAAEQRVDAGTAAMLVNVGPVLIAVLAGFLLREGFPRALVVGCAVAFAGAIVIGLATRGESADAGRRRPSTRRRPLRSRLRPHDITWREPQEARRPILAGLRVTHRASTPSAAGTTPPTPPTASTARRARGRSCRSRGAARRWRRG